MNRGRGGGNFRPTFRGGVTGRGGAFSAARQPMRGSPQFIGGGNSNRGFQGNQHGNQFQGRPQVNPRDSGCNSVSADSNRGGCRPGFRAFQQGNMFTDKRSGSPVEMQRQGNQDMNQLNERFGRQSLNESGQGDYVLVERRGRAGHIQRGLVRVTDRGAMGQGFGGSRGRGFVKPRNISSGSPTARRLATSRGSSSSPNLGRGFARQQDCDSPSSWYKSRNRSNSPSFRQGRGHIKPRDNSSSPNYIYRRDFPGPKEVGMPRPRTDSKDRDKLINKVPKEKKQQASWIPLEENEKKLEETESRPEKQKSSPEKQKSSPEKQKPSPEKQKTSPQKVQLSLENKDLNKDCSSVEEVLSLSLFTVSEDATSGKVVESSLHEKFGDLKDTTNRGACSDKGEGDRNNNSRTASGNKRSWLETASGERSKQRTLSGERKGRHNKASGKRQGRIGTVSGKSSRHETVSGERSRRETVSGESRSRHGISFGEKSRPKQSRREVSNQKKTISQDIFQDKLHSNMPVFNRRQNVQEGIRHIGHISRRDAALYTNPRKLVRSHSDESEYCFERSEMVFDRRLSPDFERLDTHSGRSYEDISSPDHRHWRHVSNDTRSSSNERNRKFESLSPSKYSHARSLSREHRSNSGERRFESSFSRFKEYHTDKLRHERSNSFERRREEANSELKNDDFKRFSRNGRSSSGERSRESFSSFKKHNPSSISRSSSGEAKNREESISSFEKYYPRNLSRETSSEKRMEDLSFQKYDPSSRSGSVERRKVTASVTAFQKYLSKSLKSDEKRPQKAFFTRSNSKKRRPHVRLAFNKEHSECLTSPKDDARFENSGSGQKKDHGSISLERCGDDRAHYSSEEYHNYNRMKGTYERNYDLDASEIFSDSDASAVQSFEQKKKETDPDFSRSRKRVSGREMFDTERPFDNIDSEDTNHLYRLKDNPESYQFGGDHVGHGPDQRGDLYDPCHPLETESDQREEIFDYFQRERCQDGPKENTFVKERKSLFNESMSDISSDSKLGEDDEGSEDAFCVSVSQKTHESVLVHLDHKNSENCDEGDKEDFLQLKDKQENRKSNWKEVQSASKEGSSGPFLAKTTKKSKSGTESQSQDHANGENPFEEKPEKLPKESSRKDNFVSSCLKEGYSTYAYEDDSSSSDKIESVKATKPKIYIDFRKAPIRRFSKDKTDFTRKSLDDTECQQFKFADKVKPQDVFEVQNIAELDSNDGTSSIGDIHELLEKSYKEKSSILKDKVAKDVRPSPLCVDMDRDSSGTDVQILPMDKMRNLSNERQRVVESSGSSDSESSSESSPKFARIREKRLSSGNRCSRKKSSSSFTSASSSSSSGSSSSSSSRSRSRSPKGSRTLRSFSTTRKRPPQGSKTLSSCTRSRSPRGFRTQRSYSRSRQRYPRGSKTQRFSTRTKKRYPEGPMSSKITSRQKTITSDSNSSSSDVTYDSSDSLSKNYSSTSRSSYEKKKSRPRKWKPWCHFGYGRNAFSPSVRPGRGQERRSVSVARSKLNFYDKFRFKCKQWIRAQEPEIKAAERRLIKEIVTEDAVTKDTSSLSKESSSELVVATQNLKISKMGETTTMELDSVQLKLQTHSSTDMKLDKSAEKALKGNKIEKQRSLSENNSDFDTKVSNEITDNSKELKPIKALALQESEAGDVAFTGKKDIDCSKKTEISLSQSQNLSVKSKEESSLHSPVHKTGGAKVSPIQRKLMMGVKLAKSTSPKKSFWNDKQKRRYTKSFVFSPTKKQTPKEKPPDPGSHRKLVFDDTSSPEKSSQKQNEQAVKQQISSETHDNLSSLTGDQALWTLKGKEEIKEISLNLSDIPLPETPIKKAVCVEDARAVAEDSTKATASFRKREVSKETTSDHEEVDMDLDEEDSLGLEEDTTWFEPKVANNLGTSEAATTSSAVQEACSTDTSQYPADLCSYWSSQGYMNPGCPMGYPQHNYWSSGQSMQYYYDPYYTYQYSGNSQYSVGQSCGSVCSADEPPIPGNQETSKPPSLSEVQGTTVLPPLPKDQGNTVAPPLPDDQGTTVPQPLPEDQGTAIPKPLPEDQGSMVSPRMPEDQVTTQLPSFIRGYGISVPPPNEIGITSPRHSPEKHASAKPVLLLKDNGTKQPEHEHEIGKYPSMPEYQGTTQLPYVQEEHHTDKPKAQLEDCLSLLQKNLKKISENQQSTLLKKFRSKSQLTHEEPLTLSNYDPKCKNVATEPEILICNDASVKSLDPQAPHVRSPNQVIVSSETGDKYLQQKSTSSKPRQLSGQSQTVSPEKLIASLQVLIQAAPVKIPSQAQALSTQAPRISSQSHSVYSQSLSIHQQSSLKPPLPVPSVTPPVHPASIVPDSVHVPVPVPPPRQLSSSEHQNTSHLFQSLLTSLIPPIDEIQTPKPVPPPRDFKCASSPFTSLPKTLPNPCAISSDQPSTYATAETRSMKSLEPKLMPKQKMTPSTDQPSAFVLKNSQAEGKQASALSNFSNLASKESELHRKTTTEMSSDLVSTVKIPKSPSTVSKDPRLRKSFEQNKALPKGPSPGDGQSLSKDSQQGGSKTSVQLKQLSYSLQPKKRSRNLGAHSKYLKQLKSVLTSSLAKSKSSKESFPKRERHEMSQSSDTKRTPFVAPLPNFALTKVHSQKNPTALADSDYSDCPIETECQPSRTFSSLPKYCKQRSDGPNVCPQNIMRQEGNDAPKISYHPNHDNVDQQPFYVNQYRPSNYSTKDQQNDTNSALRSTYPNPEQRTVTIPNRQSNTKPDLQPTYSNPCSTRPSAVLNDPIRDLQTNCSSPFPTRPSAQQAYPKQDTARPSAQCLNQPNNNKNPDHQPYYQDQEIPPNYTNPDQSAHSTNQPITGQPCYPNQHPAHILSPSLLSSSASNPSNPINKQSRDPRLQAQAKQQDKTRIAIKTLFKTVSRSQSSTPPEKHETKSSRPRTSRGATILVPGVTKTPESVKSYGGKNTSGILKPVNLQEVYERDGNSGAKTAEVDNGSSNISDGYWKGLGENNEAQGSSQSSIFPSFPAAARTAADVSKTLQTGGVHKPSPATLISPFKLSPSSAFAATASTASLKSQLTPESESSGTRPSTAPALSSAKTVSLAAASQRPTPDAAVLKAEDQNLGENISLSTVNTIPPSARRSNSKVVSSKCSTSSSGRRSGHSANIVVPLVDIPKDLDTNKSSVPSPPTENSSKTLSPADHSLNPESCPKPMNELDEHNLEPNIEFEELPQSSTDLTKNKESEAALKDVEVSKDSWMSITPMKITKRSISENLTSEQEAWHAEGMDTSSTLESKSVESDMKQGSGQQKYVNLSSYGSDSQSSLLSEKVRGLSHKDVSEWVKKSSAQSQFEESPSHRHKKHKEKRRHHSSSSTSPRSNRDWERSDVGKSSKSHRSHRNDTRRIMEVSPRSKEFLKSRSVDPSEDSSDFPEADSEGTDPMKTPSKHKLLIDSSQLSKLKANFARSPLLKAKSCPSSQGTKYAPEISNSLGSYKIPKKNSTPSSGSAEHEKSTKSGHICKGSSKSENETSPDHPQNSSDSDDDLFNETPAFLREFEETSKAILNAPVMNRTADHSEIESTQSDDSFVLEEGPVQSIAVNKPDKSTFSLDALLAERVENEETERELQFMQKELKEVIKQGGFVRLAEEDVEEDDLLPEHHEKLEYFQVSVNTIQDEHPGETVLRPGRFPCVYTQTLSPLRCGFQPGSSFIETHLANIQPDALTDLLTTDMLSMCFHLIKEQEEILRWIFFIMCVHEDSCVVQGCKKLIFDIIHSQLAADESTTTWAPAVPDVLKVLVNFGGDSKELLGKQRLYSEEEIRECDCPENDADLVQGQGNMSTRSYAENIREYLQTLAFALQGRPPYSAVELNTLFLMIAKLAMEKELAQNVLLYEFTVVISSLVKCYSNEDWDAVMPGLCRELSEVTSHHHNCEYLAQLFHHDTRCTALQRRLAYLLLYKMLLPGINVNRMQIINFKLRNLAVFFPKLRDLAENDLYALYSAICLMDVAVGNERLKGQEKADLQYLMELLRTLTSDIRDNVRRLDHTRVKDLMVRISSKWTVTLQLTSSKQRNMFAWTKQKSPQKMQVQRLETGASDAESEEEDGEEKGEEEEEIVPMEEDGVIGDTNKEDEKPEEGTNEVKTAESNIKNETSKNDVDEAKQSAVDSEMSARKFEDFENLNESISVGFVKNENLNCNNNAETEDLSQQSSGSYIEDLPIVLEVIPHSGQYEYVGMSSDDESLPELDLTLCNEL